MKERPILMNGDMVTSILEGFKDLSRRAIKPQPYQSEFEPSTLHFNGLTKKRQTIMGKVIPKGEFWSATTSIEEYAANFCPFGKVGDQLWVRENWNVFRLSSDLDYSFPFKKIPKTDPRLEDGRHHIVVDYAASGIKEGTDAGKGPWRPSIHMPRWASRLQLEITNIRIERLQDISEDDARREGLFADIHDFSDFNNDLPEHLHVHSSIGYRPTPKSKSVSSEAKVAFEMLWRLLYGYESWKSNPLVWVIEFKRVERSV